MQDEHFMQDWNHGHRRLSADLDRGLGLLTASFSRSDKARKGIRDPYGIPAGSVDPIPPRAKASLRGLAATMVTVALWAVVLMVATPTPGLAAARDASTTPCACTVLLPLA